MTRNQRLDRIRKRLPAGRQAAPTGWWSEADVLAACEEARRAGVCAAEPDFPLALEEFRRELETARARADPPFEPPVDFLPGLADLPRLRAMSWRNSVRFEGLSDLSDWLLEILGRALGGHPPLSQNAFAELAAWFRANDERLCRQSRPSGLLDLGNGRQTTTADLRYGIAQGPRAVGAGRLAEDLRLLRQREGDR